MGILRLFAFAALGLAAAITTGCVQKEFQDAKAQAIMGGGPIHLDAEQVSLTNSQVECGVQSDLWDAPAAQTNGVHTTLAHLEQAGRDLHFDDDVVVTEPGFRSPYVQVRGDFMLQLADGLSIHNDGPDSRRVEGKLSVIINQSCFTDPLPVLGVRKGQFTQDANPVMQFELQQDGWHFIKLVH